MARIHETAVVSPKAEIANDACIGPYCVVGDSVHLAAGVKLHSHVVVTGHTHLGERCEVYPFASIGHAPQDKKYKGEPSTVSVGADTVIRECVTIQPGTEDGGMRTVVGASCLLMASVHVAHDCLLDNNVIMANNATLGGHVTIGEGVILGGLSAMHQFTRVGKGAMVAGMTGVARDVIPYGMVGPAYSTLGGLNVVGLRRAGVKLQDIQALRDAYDWIFCQVEGTLESRVRSLPEALRTNAYVQEVVAFLGEKNIRGFCLAP